MGVFKYPEVRRDETVVEEYHGTKVVDSYRWLEDPDSEETKAFVEAQNKISEPFLEKCPVKEKIKNRITDIWDYPKYGCPKKEGDHFYYSYNTGLQNQSVKYVQDSLEAEARVFLDPNKLSEDGTVSLRGASFTEDGSVYAYGLSKSGSDWISIHFKKAPSGEDLPDVLERCKFSSMAWLHDHTGFFYNSYPEQDGKTDGTETTTNLHQKLYYHKLGTKQSDDILVSEFPDNPKWMTGCEISDCGKYILIYVREGCEPVNRLYYVDIQTLKNGIDGKLPYVKVVDNFDAEYEYITNEGTVFTFKTNLKAPRYKLINIDFTKPEMTNWSTLVEEDEKSVLEWVGCVNENKLVLCYLEDVKNKLYIHDLATGTRKAELPIDVGTIVGYSGKKKNTEIFYQFMSFLTPGVIYRCDMTTDNYSPKVFREINVKDFDVSGFETKQVFYASKDGTKIPMFIVHKKGLNLDGSHPVLLYGYGGFSVSISPTFSPSRLVLLQHLNVVYALANIRGGGEYGETWHKDGCLGNKQNGFDDFQSAAQYLIDNKYTSPNRFVDLCLKNRQVSQQKTERIAIQGGSNGGLLVAACSNQRPDLFGAAIGQVGVLDMLRFHKFTIGHAWTTDYGCSDKPEDFNWLYKYSPLHNINVPEGDVQYPSMLLLTGDHDDRVVPLHSLKYIAEVQRKIGSTEKQKNPLIIRIDTQSGHGAGKPTKKVIEEVTDIYSFLYTTLKLEWKD